MRTPSRIEPPNENPRTLESKTRDCHPVEMIHEASPVATRSKWRSVLDLLRTSVGLKPIHLAERWAKARIGKEEVIAQAHLLKTTGEFELSCATARQIEMQAAGQLEIDQAIASLINRVAVPESSQSQYEELTPTIQKAIENRIVRSLSGFRNLTTTDKGDADDGN